MGTVNYWDEATQSWVKAQAPQVESYTKTETDALLDGTYTKEEIDERFAPAGYGLGVYANDITSWKGDHPSGFYSSLVDGPVLGYYWHGFINALNYNNRTVIVFHPTYGVCRLEKVNGTWGKWEYFNPPMHPGVEWPTTERWNGNPVFTKANSDGTVSKYYKSGDTNIAIPVPVEFETGTWTPTIDFATATGVDGRYTRIGNLVTVMFGISFESLDTSAKWPMISGLPYIGIDNEKKAAAPIGGTGVLDSAHPYLLGADPWGRFGIVGLPYEPYAKDFLASSGWIRGSFTYFTP